MNAQEKDRALADRIHAAIRATRSMNDQSAGYEGYGQTVTDARALRRAQMTLHRWAEEECNGMIQRVDNGDGYPVRHYGSGSEPRLTARIPDRERGALARVAKVCKDAGLFFYHQTDPRGCALYVGNEPLTDQNYSTRGIACL